MSSVYMNDLQVLIHDRREAPMFHDSRARPIRLKYNEPTNRFSNEFLSVQEYKIKIKATVRKSSTRVKMKSIETRKCRLENETEGLVWFKKYSEKNCIFECKVVQSFANCHCLPLWIKMFLSENELLRPTKICDVEVGFQAQ